MKYSKITAALAAVLMLTSCTAKTGGENNISVTGENSALQSRSDQTAEQDYSNLCMQRLSIQTVNKDPNVMDFLTVPVSGVVSTQMSYWGIEDFVAPPVPYYEA